ncbi:MAG: DNA gyrase inhibitor YacG [Chromatiales bacterium]|jgi:uncharacterized protein|nr:DNA gyrase inhibitor YacG [Chromatiales bacterium]
MTTTVPCPTCAEPVQWTKASTFRPFCSKRCRLLDLGEWLDDERKIPDSDTGLDDVGEPY